MIYCNGCLNAGYAVGESVADVMMFLSDFGSRSGFCCVDGYRVDNRNLSTCLFTMKPSKGFGGCQNRGKKKKMNQ